MVRLQSPLVLGAVVSIAIAQDLSAINNLPPCGKTCINNELALAPSLGCANNDITCLCENMSFGLGVRDCLTQTCPSGTDIGEITSVGNAFCQAAISAAGSGPVTAFASAVSATFSGILSASTPTSTANTISAVSTTPTGILTANTISAVSTTPSGILSASTPASTTHTMASGTTSSDLASSTKTVLGHAPSQSTSASPAVPPSSGFDSSAKIGIGLGVPLGVIIILVVMFLLIRYWKYKKSSRARHSGTLMATGLYNANDNGGTAVDSEKLAVSKEMAHDMVDDKHRVVDDKLHVVDDRNMNEVHEIQGVEAPAYSKQSPGSPRVSRYELPTRRGSV